MANNISFIEPRHFEGRTFVGNSNGKPVFILVKAGYCGWCKKFEPTFQAVADKYSSSVFFGAIRADNGTPGEAELAKTFKQTIDPRCQGYPHLSLFVDGNLINAEPTSRSETDVIAFLKKYTGI